MAFTATVIALFALLILGLPIAICLFVSGLVGYVLFIGFRPGLDSMALLGYTDVSTFVIAAIPLYIFMGQLMLKGEAGRDLFDLAQRAVGKVPGGLAVASIVASAIFAAISGSSTATAATIGSISIPEMLNRGYSRKMAAGAVAVAGTLGILIPPSISFILYSLVTNTSVGALFKAGLLPGIMLAFLFSIYSVFAARRQLKLGTAEPVSSGEDAPPFNWGMLGSLLLIPLVLGGIYSGFFTATEAAGVGVVYAFLLTVFAKRTLNWDRFWAAARGAVVTSCMILMLIAGASIFGNTLSLLRIPQSLAAWLQSMDLGMWEFLAALNIMYLILGMFMDASAAILVTVPIILPALEAQDINLIWFGVILVINMEIGAVTPPLGMNLFVVLGIQSPGHPDFRMSEVLKGSLPYAIIGLIGLALVMLFPQIALFLPGLL